MKTILVPTDHSAEARNALVYALELAIQTKASILLLHAFHQQIPLSESTNLGTYIAKLETNKKAELEDYVRHMQADLSKDFAFRFHATSNYSSEIPADFVLTPDGHHYMETLPHAEALRTLPIQSVAVFGNASQKILEAMDTYSPDVVVMGMRGADPLGRAILGSVVTEVMLRSTVPVLAVPLAAKFTSLATILYAIDLKTPPNLHHLSFLQDLGHQVKTKYQLLHLYNDTKDQELERIQENLQLLSQGLSESDFTVFFKSSGNVLESIQAFLQEHKPDLLVVAPHKHTYLDIILKKSITGTLSAHTTLPLLTLPAQETSEARGKFSSFPETQESF